MLVLGIESSCDETSAAIFESGWRLRSNVVARWEYRPGSALFLVWQQNRAASDARGPLVNTSGLLDTFAATGDNFFAVKLSYWITPR